MILKSVKQKKKIGKKFKLRVIAFFKEEQRNLVKCVEICGIDTKTNTNICKQCLDNFHEEFVNDWFDGNNWKITSRIKPNFQYNLKDWVLRMEFKGKLIEDMKTWITVGDENTSGKKTVILTAEPWNAILEPSKFLMTYEVGFEQRYGKEHLICAQFCGQRTDNNEFICQEIKALKDHNSKNYKGPNKDNNIPRHENSFLNNENNNPDNDNKNFNNADETQNNCKLKYNYKEVLKSLSCFMKPKDQGSYRQIKE